MKLLHAACTALVLAALTACGTGARVRHGAFVEVPHGGDRVTSIDFLEAGRRHVAEFLLARPDLRELVRGLEQTCVRIEARAPGGDDARFSADMGSGVSLGVDGLVLTAGHVVAGLAPDGCSVVTVDGERLGAVPIEASFGDGDDWALLRLERPLATARTLELRAPRKGETLVLLGYPGGNVGRGTDGRLRLVTMHRDQEVGLAPIAVIVRVVGTSPIELAPVAGVLPPHGMSGGPVFDAQGRLVSVLSGVSRTDDGGGTTYTIDGSSLDAVARRLSDARSGGAR